MYPSDISPSTDIVADDESWLPEDTIDISTEERRIYRFPGNEVITIENPVHLIPCDDGHQIIDHSWGGHFVPHGWIHLNWIKRPGAPPIVY